MIKSDYQSFVGLWLTAHEISVSNKAPSNNAVSAIFETLLDYDLASIKDALIQYRKRNKFAPTPYDVIELLETYNKRPSADEAWSMCPINEEETTVWTNEMSSAYKIAFPLIQEKDRIGARMAFKSAYDRLCNLSLLHSKPIAWKVSIGYDKDQIKPVVEQAVIAGRLTRKQAVKYIPAPKDAGPIAGLLTGKVVNINSKSNKNIKSHLLGIKKQLSDIDKKQRSEELARQEEEIKKQNEFDEKKREAEILLMRKDLSK